MLHLTRKESESILIDDRVEIIVTKISSGSVKLGFKFHNTKIPPKILRKEIHDKVIAENRLAAQTSTESLTEIIDIMERT